MPVGNLFYFNVGNEATIPHAEKQHYTPPRLIRKMRSDLASLPLLLAEKSDDVVLVSDSFPREESPMSGALRTLQEICLDEKTYQLALWGPEPPLERELSKSLGAKLRLPRHSSIKPALLYTFFDRSLGVRFLERYYPAFTPSLVYDFDDLQAVASQYDAVVAKQPFSSSGRGVFAFTKDDLHKYVVAQRFNLSFPLLVEPRYEVVSNWASEYRIDWSGEVHFLGLSHFVVDKFRYRYNILAPERTLTQMLANTVSETAWHSLINQHKQFLAQEVAPFYVGDVGIDMFVYKGGLHPCCEINLRTTMGHLALAFSNRFLTSQVPPLRMGIDYIPKASYPTSSYAPSLSQLLKGKQGRFLLTPIVSATSFFAYVEIDA